MIPETKYRVVRYYQNRSMNMVLFRDENLANAHKWCRDPESSSDTCKLGFNRNHTAVHGPWFDGYEEEKYEGGNKQ